MKQLRIGGMFPLEHPSSQRTDFLQGYGADTRYYMSGRCALYACLLDIASSENLATDSPRIAYVPAYTCETVLASYQKAGYALRFYEISTTELTPVFRKADLQGVSVLNLCAYYGFSRYDEAFLQECKRRGITIIQDTTHSLFSQDGHSAYADYYAGSVRKWMGIACGGVAIKREGTFSNGSLASDPDHLQGRYRAMQYRAKALASDDPHFDEKASEVFWETELRLRQMFDAFGSDAASIDILTHFDPAPLVARRRENYQTVLRHYKRSSQCQAVFETLDDSACPSHFTMYSEDRERAQKTLEELGIRTTTYWPLPPMLPQPQLYPQASWIYNHVFSIQIDQRYTAMDMEYLGKALARL
ncbi:MAG: hypothetical protein CVV52_05220 [Spirochaetae bacterium HGW-Spirochaetae-8]|jgi:hypothetical protein|nr:MAG: hypothetical protein CVV52_05220 [Spirochaetae bacterium HGW-Spirochaetae-8]